MTNQLLWDHTFLEMCDVMSNRSKCVSRKVCAIATKNNRIIATGINGSLPGFQNCCDKFPNYNDKLHREEHHKWSLLHEAHAEDNLIAEFSKNNISSIGATIYINLQPCSICSLRLPPLGIKRIVFSNKYDKGDINYSKKIFKHCNISLEYLTINN